MTPRQTALVLGRWADGPGTLQARLAAALHRAARRGELPPGALLPPERALALELAVSRTTVVGAYAELKREGVLQSRQGRGTWVPGPAPVAGEAAGAITSELFAGMLGDGGGLVDLSAACPHPSALVRELVEAVGGRAMAAAVTGSGYISGGLPELREAVAGVLTGEGLPTTPEQVVITNGAHQAISLAVAVLGRRGAPALMETCTYPGALDVVRAAGMRTAGVEMDEDGVLPDALAAAVARARPALVYLVPAFHNPTGALLAPERARAIAEAAVRDGTPLIEDQVMRDLHVGGRRAPAPIAAHAPDAPIVTVGSLSKVYWGGLRVGWARAPRPIAERLARARVLADLAGPLIAQHLALHLLAHRAEAVRARVTALRETLGVLEAALAAHLPEWSWRTPAGGGTLWARLPWGDATGFAQMAQRAGVAILPGPAMSPESGHEDRVRLPFMNGPDVVEEGVRRLAQAWEAYARTAAVRAPVIV
ncbi:MAG TPA: PLP-dependent aminotransferase family protein [Miltoncostaeaceae bacterium]|nr:PLP-dependent aminotransferase family protein [Miltoncostaeaceae bacterium]